MKQIFHLVIFVCAALVAFSRPAIAAPGDLDISFGNGGVVTTAIGSANDIANGMVVQSDGKIVVVGKSYNGSNYDFAVVRYNPDGVLDTTFNVTGKVLTDFRGDGDNALGLALQSDGKIVVVGGSVGSSRQDFAVARYNTDGSLDASFGPAGNGKIVTTGIGADYSIAYAVTVQADGKILAAGDTIGSGQDIAVVRYNPNGTLDDSFGTGGLVITSMRYDHALNDRARGIALQSNGKIVVGGGAGVYNGNIPSGFGVVRYNSDGTLDSSFNGNGKVEVGDGYAAGIALQSDGKVVMAGRSYGSQNFFLNRLTPTGALDIAADTGIGIGDDGATSVALQSDGKMMLAGYSYNANTAFYDMALARYNADGSLDTGFHSSGKVTTQLGSGDAYANSVAIQADGRILVAGESSNGSKIVFTVARYFAFGNLVTTTPANGSFTNNNMPVISGTANASATVNVYLDETNIGSTVASADDIWSFTPTNALADGSHTAKAVDAADNTGAFSNPTSFTVDTVAPTAPVVQTPANGAFTNNTRPFVSGTAEPNTTVTVYLDNVFAGTATASGVGAWSFAPAVALADGQHTVKAKATDRAGNTGAFSNTNTFLSSSTIAGTPGDLDISFGNGGVVTTAIGSANDIANGMVVQSDGKIVVVGKSYNGSNYDFAVVRYNPDGVLDTTFNVTGKVLTDFRGDGDNALGLALQSDGKIVVVGGSVGSSRQDFAVARYNTDGSLDASFGPAGNGKIVTTGIGADYSFAYAVTVQADGKILAAGNTIGSGQDIAVVRYNADGTLDDSFGTGGLVITSMRYDHALNDNARGIVVQGDGKIVVAGGAGVYNGNLPSVVGVVRYNANGTLDGSFNGSGKLETAHGLATGIALQADGKFVLAGRHYSAQDFALNRVTPTGALDIDVNTGIGIGDDGASTVALQSDGKIVLAGYSYNANTAFYDMALVRYNADGSLDTGFHSTGKVTTHLGSGDAYANCVAIQADGRILVAGESSNGSKIVFTVARYFGSDQPPIVHTGAAGGVSKTSATLAGTVNPNSLATTAHFEYGLDATYGSVTSDQACGNGTTAVSRSAILTGLAANTTYHFRLVAMNSATLFGGTTFGADATFTTAPDPPVAVTAASTAVSATGATLAGVVFPNGRVTTAYFDYGLTAAYGSTTPVQTIPAGTGAVNVFAPVTGLIPGGTYHFRVVANNSGSPIPIEGADQSFQANDPPPTVVTGGAVALANTSARVNGTVRANNTNAQVFVDYGTTPALLQFTSITATPALVTGNLDTPVSADIPNLSQGVTYYYRVRAQNAGGTSLGLAGSFTLNVLSGFVQQFPGVVALGDRQGFVFVILNPAGIGAGWRFVGEQQWRSSGVVATGFTSGNRVIEFRPVPGYIQPPPEPVAVISGGAPVFLSGNYFLSGAGTGTGSLSVTLKPDALADVGVPEAERAQWRLLAVSSAEAGPWLNTQDTIGDLFAGNYLVECKPVAGRATPPPGTVTVQDGQTSIPTVIYYLADSPTGTPPGVLPFETVSTSQNLPYAYVGQIRSEVGTGTGFVVRRGVVATAGHVVFDDATFSSILGLQWLFERDRGSYEPVPQVPRGYYLLAGYSAQRALESTPGSFSPESRVLDTATLWFLEDAGRGGFGGYLASDLDNNEWLTTIPATAKTLVGYPVDGIPAANQGRMHATPPMAFAFTHPLGAGHIYATDAIRSFGGNSGGPLCVQFEGGNYYPAAIFLGGNAQSIVRAIDSDVIHLFNLAETSSITGIQANPGGGIPPPIPQPIPGLSLAQIQINFEGSGNTLGNARWNPGDGIQHTSGQNVSVIPGTYSIQFSDISPYLHRDPYSVTVTGGVRTTITVPCNGIIEPLRDKTKTAFESVALGVTVSNAPTSYQWRKNGVDIDGATGSSISFTSVRGSDAADYSVVVTWVNGSQLSDIGTLTVNLASQTISFPKPADRLLRDGAFNLSATSATSNASRFVTFTIDSGAATLAGNGVTLTPTGPGTVTVRASLAGNTNYSDAPDVHQSFQVSLETLTSWRSDHFTATEFNNVLISGPTADPERDGMNNLLEFGLNLDPKVNDSVTMIAGTGTRGLPLIQREPAFPFRATAEFVRRKAGTLPGVTYRFEFSSNLANPANWTASVPATEVVSSIDATWERVKVTDPTASPLARFGRLVITQP